MTKKSSFLRQLNLYNFNRISMGPDQGSYYHEYFLKGMRFLCRRIMRQRINGNGIRAAANPDDEPVFSSMTPCPPQKLRSSTEKGAYFGDPLFKKARIGDDSDGAPRGIAPMDSFPLKLQCILDKMEADDNQEIIHWCNHGRAFIVSNQTRLCEELLPKYFQMSKYPSFVRQLGTYNFKHVTEGDDEGAYYHEFLQRGRPELAQAIHRAHGKGSRGPMDDSDTPDFSSLPTIPPIKLGAHIEIPVPETIVEQQISASV